MTLDMELRGRTEGQTAIDYVSGNGYAYELTRIRGGLESAFFLQDDKS
jgi:hypothetical protein